LPEPDESDGRTGGILPIDLYETANSYGVRALLRGTLQVDGYVEGDLLGAGGTVNVNGKINGSVMAAGGNLTVNGTTGGSIRAAGGTITVGGSAGRDVVATGGQLNLSPASHVTGDVVFTCGQLTLDGTVQGNVLGSASTYTKNGTVAGTENVTIQQHREQPSQPWGAVGGIRTLVFAVALFMVFLADAWVGYALGRLILDRVQSSWAKQPIWSFLIGATIVVLLTTIPVVGGLIKFAVILLALGGLVLAFWRWRHPLPVSQAAMGSIAPAATLPSASAT
jgi:hypothetical protein